MLTHLGIDMGLRLLLVVVIPALVTCQTWNQATLNLFSQHLKVSWKVKDNTQNELTTQVEVTLTNEGSKTLSKEDQWGIYFDCIYMIEPGNLPHPDGYVLPGQGIVVTHLTGTHFKMEPTEDFLDFPQKKSRKIKFKMQYWSVAMTDIMPNWYIIAPLLQPMVIQSTVGNKLDFVESFGNVEQFKRYDYDMYSPYTAQERYARNRVEDIFEDDEIRIVPRPHQVKVDREVNMTFDTSTWKILAPDTLNEEAAYLREKANIEIGAPTAEYEVIRLLMEDVHITGDVIAHSPDAYSLDVDPANQIIIIKGNSQSGVFYGVQTLLNLIENNGGILYDTFIKDAPRFEYRGMHLDVARNFHSKEDVIKLLDLMSMYKLNKFHFHLTDDEGWRLEIPKLPELTQIGARRCYDIDETKCLLPQIGSGPTFTTSGSGFYTTRDYRDILKEAKRRHIEVIPEFDMPGHARAAIKAMEVRHIKYARTNTEEAMKFKLVEENDPSKYFSTQMFTDNAINPCLNSTYAFIEYVMDQVLLLHQEIQPLRIFNFGGDEVAKGAWVNSTACQTMSNSIKVSTTKLKEHFFTRVAELAASKNLNLAAWEDGLMHGGSAVYDRDLAGSAEVYAFTWDNVWEWGSAGRAYNLSNHNYKVVMAQATHLYFDHPYEPDPEEMGYYWATRFTDSQKTFGFMPENIYENIDTARSGKPLTREQVCGDHSQSCPPLKSRENIAGIQGQLWSETVRTSDDIDYRLFPRMLALAERAWHRASWEKMSDKEARNRDMTADWESFARAVGRRELHRLDSLGVKYRIPPPGGRIEDGILKTTSSFPGLPVQYSQDGGQTWYLSTDDVIISNSDPVLLRTRSADLSRNSRVVTLHPTPLVPIVNQPIVDNVAQSLVVKYAVLDNFKNGAKSFIAQISLTNKGAHDIQAGNWGLYLFSIYKIEPDYPNGFVFEATKVKFTHIDGCLFKMETVHGFEPIKPGEQRKLKITIQNWSVSRTDVMPNWYIWAEGMKPRIISSTTGEGLSFVADFDTPNKWKRYNTDNFKDYYDPYSPATRFRRNEKVHDLGTAPLPIIPTPVSMETGKQGTVSLATCCWVIVSHPMFMNQADYLRQSMIDFGMEEPKMSDEKPPKQYILIKFAEAGVEVNGNISSSPDAYTLTVDPGPEIIEVTAVATSGAFYGIQTILSLALKHPVKGTIPGMTVKDEPRFEFRGMHLDVGRNFHSLDSVLTLLDVMAMYKLNKFHFHLTDDEGWRLEIPGLEELTMVGGRRCHDLSQTQCLSPQLGSGPFSNNSGSGYYTKTDYQTILGYAAERQIEVIPEIDMPGHAHAAIRALEARRLKLLSEGDFENADIYNLRDPQDTSKYSSNQMFTDNAVNPCINTTYTFILYVMSEIEKMHRDINPLRTFHFGGDEVAVGAWVNSTACQRLKQFSPRLKEYMIQRASLFSSDLGVNLGSWEDGLTASGNEPFDRSLLINKAVYANAWDNVWEWGTAPRAYIFANSGYKVVMSQATHLYFDHPYEPDPEERGYYWATRYTDTRKTFGFMPDNLYGNIDVQRTGKPITRADVCGQHDEKCPSLTAPENIVGMQGHLWSETSRTSNEMFYMIFPRLLALAERVWHKSSWESIEDATQRESAKSIDWEKFANSLGHQDLLLLDRMGIPYRIPPPGGRVFKDVLIATSPFPGLPIEASFNGGRTWTEVTRDGIKVKNGQTVTLTTKSADNTRRSRAVTLEVSGITVVAAGGAHKPMTSCATFIVTLLVSVLFRYTNH
ncbi:uncharacterized protein LOC124131226 [Haliotis rufescens]|uniref:uncharacterized protein LOC124131226 n=1 Tax=Haliotis rufescens TaxID=6454 RepID=UPI00201E7F34|nr:uncharacterized protein LOC124131226 [Haliotis rufescens]